MRRPPEIGPNAPPVSYVEYLQQQADQVAQKTGFQAAEIADPELFSQSVAQAAQAEEQATGQPSEARAVIESDPEGATGFLGALRNFGSGVLDAPSNIGQALGVFARDEAPGIARSVGQAAQDPETVNRISRGFVGASEFGQGALEEPFTPLIPESAVQGLPEEFGIRRVAEAATQLTSPFDIGLTAVTAGAGPAIVRGVAGPGARNAVIRAVGGPITQGGLAERVAAEAAVGTGAVLAGQEASERLPDNPLINVPGSLGAALLGGGAAIGGIQGARAALDPAARQAAGDAIRPRATANAFADAADAGGLRYDPATNRYNGGTLTRGDVLVDDSGRLLEVERANGFTIEAQVLDESGERIGGQFTSFDLDDFPGNQRFLNVRPTGRNLISDTNLDRQLPFGTAVGADAPTPPQAAVPDVPAPRAADDVTGAAQQADEAPILKQTPTQATRSQTPLQTEDPRISSVVTDAPTSRLETEVAATRAQDVAAGGSPPKRPLGNAIGSDGSTPPPRRTDVGLSDDFDIPVHEQGNIRQTLFRKFEGANSIEALEMGQWFKDGTRAMRSAGIRQFDEPTMRPLFEALHGERSVDTLSAPLRSIFDDLDQLRRAEEADMLDFLGEAAAQGADDFISFDAKNLAERFMANPDYFPRLWKPRTTGAQGRGQIGATPSFGRGRVDATFGELLDGDAARGIEGLEPATWDPYKMMANRRINGVKFRETTVLLNRLKQNGKAVPNSQKPAPTQNRLGQEVGKWRVPDIGPAFEGRPFANADGSIGHTEQIAVPQEIAKQLEDVFGSAQLLLGENVAANGFRQLTRTSKRLKLAGSFFQHVDFASRAAGAAFTPTGISRGAPVKFPSLIKDMFTAQWLPSQREKLTKEILSNQSLFKGRTGNILRGNRGPEVNVTSRMMVEEGWAVNGDITFIKRGFLDELNRMEQQGGLNEATLGNIRKAAEYFESGLFDGVYRTTHRWALKNFILPEVARRRPGATARQIAAEAADSVNLMFSSVERWQSVIKDPALRDALQTVIFSTNEQEGLIRSGLRAFRPLGRNGSQMLEWYVGLFTAMATFANLINFSATGELLSPSQYSPINLRDPYGGFSVEELAGTETERGGINLGYNRKFLSPILPFVEGEGGQPVRADLVGQMDTIFSWALSPFSAVGARLNVPIRAVQTQVQGEAFGGTPVLTRGDRVAAALSDIAGPISVIQGANALNINPLEAEFEKRVGAQGSGIQALTGINIRAISNEDVEARAQDSSLTTEERREAANELAVRETRANIRRLETALAGNPSEQRRPGMERDLEIERRKLAAAEGGRGTGETQRVIPAN